VDELNDDNDDDDIAWYYLCFFHC